LNAWRKQILAKRDVASATELSTEQASELISTLKTKLDLASMQEGLAERDQAMRKQRNGDLTVNVSPVGQGEGEKEVIGAAGSSSKSE
jgi:hypothetical protein